MPELISGNRKKTVEAVHATSRAPLPTKEVLVSLKEICPDAVFFTLIPKLDEEDTDSADEEYADLPATITSLCLPEMLAPSDNIRTIWGKYVCTEDHIQHLEECTRGQSVCPLWFEHRKGRITGTKAHDVYVRKPETPPNNLVKRVLGFKSYDLSKNKAVMWGMNNEGTARNAFVMQEQSKHSQFTCRDSGFVVSKDFPFLGASPDGITSCACHGSACVEIKCPYKHRDNTIAHAVESDNNFCLEGTDGTYKLKKKHRYFTQVQLQMYLCNFSRCSFVVYTNKELFTTDVLFDKAFCEILVEKCEKFFFDNVLPAIILGDVLQEEDCELPPENIRLYCICNEPEYGKMIKCESYSCPTEWFHYSCVDIKRKPRKAWLCTQCK